GVIPYPDPGTVNPVTYSFTATGGDVVAYFTSNGGSYTNILGLRVGATDYMSTLNNQTSTPGDSFNFGSFAAGTNLIFFIVSNGDGGNTYYSDPSLNSDGLNHIYVANYTQGGIFPASVPTGTYVGFEDIKGGGDRDYEDLTYVFTNVASGVPEPSTWAMMLIGFAGLGWAYRRRSAVAAA
ncbi:MAG: hypothetical protein BGP06_14820, partial [Rhizobiales bacterium 65-9]